MFRQIVANLPFSPSLIGQLGFYARRLRKEELTRRLGLVFTALALVVQSFAVFSPPEAQATASQNNIIYQGVRSKEDLLSIYDKNADNGGHRDIQQIYNYFGVTRQDIQNAQVGTFNSRGNNLNTWSGGRISYDAPNEQIHRVDSTGSVVYLRQLWRFDKLPYTKQNGSTYTGVIGQRAIDGKWFSISFDCGNIAIVEMPPKPVAACTGLVLTQINRTKYRLSATGSSSGGASISGFRFTIEKAGQVAASASATASNNAASTELTVQKDGTYDAKAVAVTSLGDRTDANCVKQLTVSPEPRCPQNPGLVVSSPECKPCPTNPNIWYKDKDKCKAEFESSKKVANQTKNIDDANNTTAKADDRLTYTLTTKNKGTDTGTFTMAENLSDVLEYADVLDNGGGTLNKDTGVITWAVATLKPGESTSRTIQVQLKSAIPASPQNVANPESYNCVISNTFGNTTTVNVNCPAPKVVENTVKELPSTGPGENILFGTILIMIVTYFFARSKQMGKEIRLIRHDFNTGTI